MPSRVMKTVILDGNYYQKKMEGILKDKAICERLNDDPVKLTLQRGN